MSVEKLDEFKEFRKLIAHGLPVETFREIQGKIVSPGLTAKDYVETCVDFGEMVLKDGEYRFAPSGKD